MATKPGGKSRPKSHLEPAPAPEVAAADTASTAPESAVIARVRSLLDETDAPADVPSRVIGLAEAGLAARQLGERSRVGPVAAVLHALPAALWDQSWVSELDALGSAAKAFAPILAAGDGPVVDPTLRAEAEDCRQHLLGQARHHLRADPAHRKALKSMGSRGFSTLVSDLRALDALLAPRLHRIGGDPSFRAEALTRAPELADAVEAALEAPRAPVVELGRRLWARLRTRFDQVRRVVAFVEESLRITTPLPTLVAKRSRVGPAVAAERAARKEAEAAKKAALAADKEAAAARKRALAAEKEAAAAKRAADRAAERAARRARRAKAAEGAIPTPPPAAPASSPVASGPTTPG